MKQATKLILAISSYALSLVLVLGGSLYALTDPALHSQPAVVPQGPSGSADTTGTVDTQAPSSTQASTEPAQTTAPTEPQDTQAPADSVESTHFTQTEGTQEPDTEQLETKPPMTAEIQNVTMITNQAFKTPENKYRALRIEHGFYNLPGKTSADKVASLDQFGFGGLAANAIWDDNYLQSKYALAQFNDFVQAMHDKGYRVWLYDEKGYPSGAAGDLTVKGHPEYAAVRLLQLEIDGNGNTQASVDLPDDFVKLEYALLQSQNSYTPIQANVDGDHITFTGTEGDWTAYIYCVTRYNYGFEWNSSYPNILNRDAIARFIEVTFDTYEGAIENFPEVIEAVFDDEAQLLANHHIMPQGLSDPVLPYDYDIFETFEAKYGYDPRPLLPLIYSGESAEAQRVRAQFYAHVGDLVSENYYGQIQEWCVAHGIQLSGHLLLEEQMFYHIPVYGDYIKCSQNMGYSGFDVLNVRPVSYLNDMSTGGKYASSPAWLMGKERVMIEICPVDNPDEFATNHLDYALGTMTFAYFDGGNQITSYYSQANTDPATAQAFNVYVGRLGSMTVGAQNLSQVAIYYSIDTAAACYQAPKTQNVYDADSWARKNDKLVGQLAEGVRKQGLDYVFLDDASMQTGTVSSAGLQVGNFTFTTILVPSATMMRIESMRVLDSLIDKGVNVIFVGEMPTIAFCEADQAEMDTLVQKHASLLRNNYLDVVSAVTTVPELHVDSGIRTVYVSPYEKDGVKFFFLANATKKNTEISLSFEGAVGYRIYDPVSGEIYEVEDTTTIQSFRALFIQPLISE